MAVARDVMPEGFAAADFEAAGLPVPGKSQVSSEPTKSAKGTKPASPFVCDTPDNE
jgi:hypothetical protein